MAVVVVVGVLAGYLSGGRLSQLAEIHLRWLRLVPIVAAAALVPHVLHRAPPCRSC